MNITISPETQWLLEERMKKDEFASPDDVVRQGLERFEQDDYEELDDETLAAIEEGLAQANRGQGQPWEEVRKELVEKYLNH